MEYKLRFSIGYDEEHWNLETFSKDRKKYFLKLIEKYKKFKGLYLEGYEDLEFPNGTPEMEQLLRKECESKNYTYDIGTLVNYTPKEIREAHFVPLTALGNFVDYDKNYVFLNTYTKIECPHCGRPDYEFIPDPYFIYEIVLKKQKDLYYANNGMMILSQRAFDWLRDDIEPWIDFGRPCIIDNERNIVSEAPQFVWIRPKFAVGRYVNEEILQRCSECGEPIQIAKGREGDIFERGKEIVESFCKTKAPIVRSGSWFGYFPPSSAHSRSYGVFISGWLHERIRKLRLKGFVKADYVIHAADEPYDWDPLKNNPVSLQIVGR